MANIYFNICNYLIDFYVLWYNHKNEKENDYENFVRG